MSKVCIYNKNGELIKKVKTREQAAAFAGISVASVYRSIVGDTNRTHCGYYFRNDNQSFELKPSKPSYKGNEVLLIKNNEIVKEYENQKIASEETGISQGSLSALLNDKSDRNYFIKKHGFELIYKNNYKKPTKEIIKPQKEEYYINVLVGLVNRTLVDGAIYTIKGIDYTYVKEKDYLINGNNNTICRDFYIDVCKTQLPILSEEERKFLSNLLKAFNNIVGIEKCPDIYEGFEFIRIIANNSNDNIALPKFKTGQYYANLVLNRVYTLEELNI